MPGSNQPNQKSNESYVKEWFALVDSKVPSSIKDLNEYFERHIKSRMGNKRLQSALIRQFKSLSGKEETKDINECMNYILIYVHMFSKCRFFMKNNEKFEIDISMGTLVFKMAETEDESNVIKEHIDLFCEADQAFVNGSKEIIQIDFEREVKEYKGSREPYKYRGNAFDSTIKFANGMIDLQCAIVKYLFRQKMNGKAQAMFKKLEESVEWYSRILKKPDHSTLLSWQKKTVESAKSLEMIKSKLREISCKYNVSNQSDDIGLGDLDEIVSSNHFDLLGIEGSKISSKVYDVIEMYSIVINYNNSELRKKHFETAKGMFESTYLTFSPRDWQDFGKLLSETSSKLEGQYFSQICFLTEAGLKNIGPIMPPRNRIDILNMVSDVFENLKMNIEKVEDYKKRKQLAVVREIKDNFDDMLTGYDLYLGKFVEFISKAAFIGEAGEKKLRLIFLKLIENHLFVLEILAMTGLRYDSEAWSKFINGLMRAVQSFSTNPMFCHADNIQMLNSQRFVDILIVLYQLQSDICWNKGKFSPRFYFSEEEYLSLDTDQLPIIKSSASWADNLFKIIKGFNFLAAQPSIDDKTYRGIVKHILSWNVYGRNSLPVIESITRSYILKLNRKFTEKKNNPSIIELDERSQALEVKKGKGKRKEKKKANNLGKIENSSMSSRMKSRTELVSAFQDLSLNDQDQSDSSDEMSDEAQSVDKTEKNKRRIEARKRKKESKQERLREARKANRHIEASGSLYVVMPRKEPTFNQTYFPAPGSSKSTEEEEAVQTKEVKLETSLLDVQPTPSISESSAVSEESYTLPVIPGYIESFWEKAPSNVKSVMNFAKERGLRIYLVGGAVRDWLMGLPISDYDFIMETPESLSDLEEALPGGKAIPQIELYKWQDIDIVLRPKGFSLKEDVINRDLKVNSFYLSREDLTGYQQGYNELIDTTLPLSTVKDPHDLFETNPKCLLRLIYYRHKVGARQLTEEQKRAISMHLDKLQNINYMECRGPLCKFLSSEWRVGIFSDFINLGIIDNIPFPRKNEQLTVSEFLRANSNEKKVILEMLAATRRMYPETALAFMLLPHVVKACLITPNPNVVIRDIISNTIKHYDKITTNEDRYLRCKSYLHSALENLYEEYSDKLAMIQSPAYSPQRESNRQTAKPMQLETVSHSQGSSYRTRI